MEELIRNYMGDFSRRVQLQTALALCLGLRLAALLVEQELERRSRLPMAWPPCSHCGTPLESKGRLMRRLLLLVGWVSWKRPVGRCPKGCPGHQVVPLDQELGIGPNQRIGYDVVRVVFALAVFVPYKTAEQLFAQWAPFALSAVTIWRWVQRMGKRALDLEDKELAVLAEGKEPELEAMDAETRELPMVRGADGVMVPFRPEGGSPQGRTCWKEVKVGILARVKPHITRTGKTIQRLVHRRTVAFLGTLEQFRPRFWLEALRQDVKQAPVVAWISDGSRGLWKLFSSMFSSEALLRKVRAVLDFYHAVQYIWRGVVQCLQGDEELAVPWFARARHTIRHQGVDSDLRELDEVRQSGELSEGARHVLDNLCSYLTRHLDHMAYPLLQSLGLPLGSGMVESCCKWLIQQRFKGVGMRWSEQGFGGLLILRQMWMNDQYSSLFDGPAV